MDTTKINQITEVLIKLADTEPTWLISMGLLGSIFFVSLCLLAQRHIRRCENLLQVFNIFFPKLKGTEWVIFGADILLAGYFLLVVLSFFFQ